MKLSAKSWHYRFIDCFWSIPDTVTVCSYMRAFFASLVMLTLVLAVAGFGVWLIFYVLPLGIWTGNVAIYQVWVNGVDPGTIDNTTKGAVPMALVVDLTVVVAVIVSLLAIGVSWLGVSWKWLQSLTFLQLVAAWLKAIKDKACPIIEITDLEKRNEHSGND